MIIEHYKITYRDKDFNYKDLFMFKWYDRETLNIIINKFIENEYWDIKVCHVIETEELIKEIN